MQGDHARHRKGLREDCRLRATGRSEALTAGAPQVASMGGNAGPPLRPRELSEPPLSWMATNGKRPLVSGTNGRRRPTLPGAG
jgi:hypothetical protein